MRRCGKVGSILVASCQTLVNFDLYYRSARRWLRSSPIKMKASRVRGRAVTWTAHTESERRQSEKTVRSVERFDRGRKTTTGNGNIASGRDVVNSRLS